MAELLGDQNLTEKHQSKTYAGMAHFAGTGPDGEVCHRCRYFKMTDNEYWSMTDNDHWSRPPANLVKNRPCQKAKSMLKANLPNIPSTAAACKYFERLT